MVLRQSSNEPERKTKMNALQKRMEEYARNYKQKLLDEEAKETPKTVKLKRYITYLRQQEQFEIEDTKKTVEDNKPRKLRSGHQIEQFDLKGNWLATYYTLKHCAKVNKVDHDTITECCNGIRAEHRGFIYKYSSKNDENQ